MKSIPANWILVEEWDNNYIFENKDRSFCVNVTFTEQFELPYDIGFSQLKGDFNLIGYEDGAYSTNAHTKAEAMNYPAASGRSINPKKQKQDTPQAAGELTQKRLKKSYEMIAFIDSK